MRILPVIATVVLVAAGCMGGGTSSAPRLTKAEFIKQADAICAQFTGELEALPQPQTLADLAAMATQAKPIAEAGVARLRALRPPEELEDQVNEWLELNDSNVELIERLRAGAADGDETAVQQVAADATDNEQKADALAAEIGLTDCSDSG
jgi:hypothetical protein